MMRLKNVLVATDFGETAEVALTYGRELARTFGATLHVLYVSPDLSGNVGSLSGTVTGLGGLEAEMEDAARQRLDELLSDEDRAELRAQPMVLRSSSIAMAIATYAHDVGADVIVIGTHGRRGASHFFVGSVAERVVRLAPCPVLTVRHPEREFVLPDALQVVAHT